MHNARRLFGILFLTPLLFSCTTREASDYASRYARNQLLKQTGSAGQVIAAGMDYQKDLIGFEALVRLLAKEARVNWGDEKHATRKEYVKYTNNYRTRVFVDFDKGKVHVETLDRKDLHHAIVLTLLTPNEPEAIDLFGTQDVPLGGEPVLYGQVLDHEKQPIRWQWRADRYADYLTTNRLSQKWSKRGTVYAVDFDLTRDHLQKRQYQYASLVRQYARRYKVDESLVYAIIRTESSFNPYAVSSSNAYGLMQIIPKTAGKDVFTRIKNRSDQPSKHYLFKPHNNIDTGTAYIHLLETHYLKGVRDPLSRKYTIISAYNGGAGNVFATFDRDRGRAVEKINQLKPSQVYWALTKRHPRAESRRYLEKVTTAQRDFVAGKVM